MLHFEIVSFATGVLIVILRLIQMHTYRRYAVRNVLAVVVITIVSAMFIVRAVTATYYET